MNDRAGYESPERRRARLELERYRENVGREPRNLPVEHPDRWQWLYTGSKAERERLVLLEVRA